jgi:hypothetical protein
MERISRKMGNGYEIDIDESARSAGEKENQGRSDGLESRNDVLCSTGV